MLVTTERGHGVPKPDGKRPYCDAGVAVEDTHQFRGLTCSDDDIVALGRDEPDPPFPVFRNPLEFFHERFRGALKGNSDANYRVGNIFQMVQPIGRCPWTILRFTKRPYLLDECRKRLTMVAREVLVMGERFKVVLPSFVSAA